MGKVFRTVLFIVAVYYISRYVIAWIENMRQSKKASQSTPPKTVDYHQKNTNKKGEYIEYEEIN